MRVAKEGCCKGRPEKAGLSIWDNKLWARKLLEVEHERRYCYFACEWDWPISGNPSHSTVHSWLSFYVLHPLMGHGSGFSGLANHQSSPALLARGQR
jgi:hypothetical protein